MRLGDVHRADHSGLWVGPRHDELAETGGGGDVTKTRKTCGVAGRNPSVQASSAIAAMAAFTLECKRTVIVLSRSMSFQDQNPESARIVRTPRRPPAPEQSGKLALTGLDLTAARRGCPPTASRASPGFHEGRPSSSRASWRMRRPPSRSPGVER